MLWGFDIVKVVDDLGVRLGFSYVVEVLKELKDYIIVFGFFYWVGW